RVEPLAAEPEPAVVESEAPPSRGAGGPLRGASAAPEPNAPAATATEAAAADAAPPLATPSTGATGAASSTAAPTPIDVAAAPPVAPSPASAAPAAPEPAGAPAPPAEAAPEAAAAAEPVLVNVNARPWAHIAVDGEALGVTPLGNVPIEPGLRRIRAEMADGTVIEREVRIDAANRRVSFP